MRVTWSSAGKIVTAGLAVFSLACSGDRSTSPLTRSGITANNAGVASPTRHIIVLKEGASVPALRSHVALLGGSIERAHESIGVLVANNLSAAAVSALAARADVAGVVPDHAIHLPKIASFRTQSTTGASGAAKGASNDPTKAAFYDEFQWNIRLIRAQAAYKLTKKGKGEKIADLDTGIDYTHQDLVGKVDMNLSQSFVVTEPGIEDLDFHGTWTASIMVTNGIGIASVAPNAQIIAVKVLDQTGSGSFADAIAAVIYATDVGADAINMSFGAIIAKNDPGLPVLRTAFARAAQYAYNHGVNLLAASGNSGLDLSTSDSVDVPAEVPYVLGVGAVGPQDQMNFDNIPSYSDVGYPAVTFFAPGGDIAPDQDLRDLVVGACSSFTVNPQLTACTTGKDFYVWAIGTSAAAPHATGEAAVLKGEYPKSLTGSSRTYKALHCMQVGSDAVTGSRIDPIYGWGVIDVLGGVDCRQII